MADHMPSTIDIAGLALGAQRSHIGLMAKTTKASAKTKAPGRNVEEWERGTERLTLRLDPTSMQYLEKISTEMGCTRATTVLLALEALEVLRQEKGAPMSWGTRTNVGMALLERARVTAPSGGQEP